MLRGYVKIQKEMGALLVAMHTSNNVMRRTPRVPRHSKPTASSAETTGKSSYRFVCMLP